MISIVVPIHVVIPRVKKKDKKISLTRNVWDTLHWGYKTKVKSILEAIVVPQLTETIFSGKVKVEYKLWVSREDSDLSNWCDTIGKIVQDILTRNNILTDDNVKYVVDEHRQYMGLDKENPRLEMTWDDYGME